jgi:putative transposase
MPDRIRRRRLPHWDVDGAAYFVTSCLAGSIPAQGLLDIAAYRKELSQRPRLPDQTEAETSTAHRKMVFARTDRWLDSDPAVRWFDNPDLAKVAVESLYHFADQRYDLLGFCVMPSHIHWVFRPRTEWAAPLLAEGRSPREAICKSRNQHIALECNRLLRRTGAFWQHESFDHWIRDVEELERILLYIEANPVKAGLVDRPELWPYSSAHDRFHRGLELGTPLVPIR